MKNNFMLKKIIKIFRNSAIVLVIFGVMFSNIPFYVLTGAIEGYVKTANIVDRAWNLSQNDNIVDNFIPSYKNNKIALLDKLAGNLKVQEAHAAGKGRGPALCQRTTHQRAAADCRQP